MMWLIHLLPDAFLMFTANVMILVGVLGLIFGLFLNIIPMMKPYKNLIIIISFLLSVFGAYFKGGLVTENEWQIKVKELENKVLIAEQKSKEINTVIKYKYITKTKMVKDTKIKIKRVIKEKEKLINSQCTVPQEAIDILNAAARNEVVK